MRDLVASSRGRRIETVSYIAFATNFKNSLLSMTSPSDNTEISGYDRATLSKSARKAVGCAADRAVSRGRSEVQTSDLFVGLLAQRESEAVRLMLELGLDPDWMISRIDFLEGPNIVKSRPEVLNHSPRLDKVLERAERSTSATGRTEVGSLELLSALISERTGVCALVLQSPGYDLTRIKQTIEQFHQEGDLGPR